MKMLCPHCGVKGSADDSYQGKTVKCPKCQEVFVAVPDIVSESQNDLKITPAVARGADESGLEKELGFLDDTIENTPAESLAT